MATFSPPDADQQALRQVWQLLELRRPDLALVICAQVLARNPANVLALLAQAEALRQQRRFAEAAMAARAAVGHAPESALAAYHWGRMLGQQGAWHEAEAAARTAVRLAPNDAEYRGLLAQLLCLLGRSEEALATAGEGLALNARHVGCLLWRAVALDNLKRRPMADEAFREVLRLAPANAQVHSLRGQTLLQRAECADAGHHLAEALRLDATDHALVPLLRRARRWQHWPRWMVRRHQLMRKHWYQERYLGYADSITALLLPFFWLISLWRNRHDPLFAPTRAQRWRRRQGLLVSLIIILPVLIFVGDHFKLFDAGKSLTIPQMLVLLAAGGLFHLALHLMGKKANS